MATLYVYMNGREVGEYTQARGGEQKFSYADSWLANSSAIPVSLSLPLTEKAHKGAAVVNYFDNLLPDSRDIKERIQARVGAKSSRPFDLLAEIGRDCIGAIQLLSDKQAVNVRKIKGKPLTEAEIAHELRNYRTIPLGMKRDEDFRISLAGAQEKTALLLHDDCWQKPMGSTPTTHILKLPIGKLEQSGVDLSESVENEFLCLRLLKEFGMHVAEAEIQQFEDQKTLVVKRFDRELERGGKWIIRLPAEDMCQAHGISPGLKYEADGGPGIKDIMNLLLGSQNAEDERRHFMKSVFLFWLMGAIDGHAKNFSIFLRSGGRFKLTPLYDVLSAFPMVETRQIEFKELKMAMALHGKNNHYHAQKILARHWYDEAKSCSFPDSEMEGIFESVAGNVERAIEVVASNLPDGFPEKISLPIFDGMRKQARKI